MTRTLTAFAPEVTAETVAVEVRGESLGPFFDRWLVFYDNVRSPATADLIGHVCVVGLHNEKILIRKIERGRNGRFRLISATGPTMEDVEIKWGVKVKMLAQR